MNNAENMAGGLLWTCGLMSNSGGSPLPPPYHVNIIIHTVILPRMS